MPIAACGRCRGYGKPGTGRDDQQPAHTPDTLLLYKYLAKYRRHLRVHTSATDMGTDWRDNDPKVEPLVEIYQGCRQNYEEPGAPRHPRPTTPSAAGGPRASSGRPWPRAIAWGSNPVSDHVSTHISFCSVWAEEPDPPGDSCGHASSAHVFGATDDIMADVRCGEHIMGDEFTRLGQPFAQDQAASAPENSSRWTWSSNNAYVYQFETGQAGRRVHLDRHVAGPGHLVLLCPRRAGRRRAGVGLADVDHEEIGSIAEKVNGECRLSIGTGGALPLLHRAPALLVPLRSGLPDNSQMQAVRPKAE